MKIVEVKHPLVKHKLGLMREQDISTKRFRELASEVGSLLTYEATADLETEKVTIEGWNGPENYRCANSACGSGDDGRCAGKRSERAHQRRRYVP